MYTVHPLLICPPPPPPPTLCTAWSCLYTVGGLGGGEHKRKGMDEREGREEIGEWRVQRKKGRE